MCLKALREEDATEQPFVALLRTELDGAVRNGAIAAAIVLAVTMSWGAPTEAVVVRTAGALLLGMGLYLGILLVGTIALRVGETVKLRIPRST